MLIDLKNNYWLTLAFLPPPSYIAGMAGQPAYFETVESLESAIQAFFDTQIENNGIITVSGLAYSLGFASRQSLQDYKEREEYSYVIKRALLFVESCYEQKLSGNNPTGSIFVLKNMGWKDKTETGFTNNEGADVAPVIVLPSNGR